MEFRLMHTDKLYLISFASGVAGVDSHTGDGPLSIQHSPFLLEAEKRGVSFNWDTIIKPTTSLSEHIDESIKKSCEMLAKRVSELTHQRQAYTVVGGDHTCAIGTWSGVYDALHARGEIGLIWIDAHMDSHTPETSETGHIHGMPLACLLGHGYSSLTSILHHAPKLKPQHVYLIGVRSFERGEAELLKQLNVRVCFMDEVKERGFATVFKEAVEHVSAGTIGYGLTIDIDSIDPLEAPGVDVPEPDGIHAKDLSRGLLEIASDQRLIATEIAEFDPSKDIEHMTEKMIVSFLEIIARGQRLKIRE